MLIKSQSMFFFISILNFKNRLGYAYLLTQCSQKNVQPPPMILSYNCYLSQAFSFGKIIFYQDLFVLEIANNLDPNLSLIMLINVMLIIKKHVADSNNCLKFIYCRKIKVSRSIKMYPFFAGKKLGIVMV